MILFSEVKLRFSKFEIETGKRKKKNKKTGDVEEKVLTERFALYTPFGYDMKAVRREIRAAFHRIVNGAKRVELKLYRFPQVGTALGELKGLFPSIKFTAGWTSRDEENNLFVIERVK